MSTESPSRRKPIQQKIFGTPERPGQGRRSSSTDSTVASMASRKLFQLPPLKLPPIKGAPVPPSYKDKDPKLLEALLNSVRKSEGSILTEKEKKELIEALFEKDVSFNEIGILISCWWRNNIPAQLEICLDLRKIDSDKFEKLLGQESISLAEDGILLDHLEFAKRYFSHKPYEFSFWVKEVLKSEDEAKVFDFINNLEFDLVDPYHSNYEFARSLFTDEVVSPGAFCLKVARSASLAAPIHGDIISLYHRSEASSSELIELAKVLIDREDWKSLIALVSFPAGSFKESVQREFFEGLLQSLLASKLEKEALNKALELVFINLQKHKHAVHEGLFSRTWKRVSLETDHFFTSALLDYAVTFGISIPLEDQNKLLEVLLASKPEEKNLPLWKSLPEFLSKSQSDCLTQENFVKLLKCFSGAFSSSPWGEKWDCVIDNLILISLEGKLLSSEAISIFIDLHKNPTVPSEMFTHLLAHVDENIFKKSHLESIFETDAKVQESFFKTAVSTAKRAISSGSWRDEPLDKEFYLKAFKHSTVADHEMTFNYLLSLMENQGDLELVSTCLEEIWGIALQSDCLTGVRSLIFLGGNIQRRKSLSKNPLYYERHHKCIVIALYKSLNFRLINKFIQSGIINRSDDLNLLLKQWAKRIAQKDLPQEDKDGFASLFKTVVDVDDFEFGEEFETILCSPAFEAYNKLRSELIIKAHKKVKAFSKAHRDFLVDLALRDKQWDFLAAVLSSYEAGSLDRETFLKIYKSLPDQKDGEDDDFQEITYLLSSHVDSLSGPSVTEILQEAFKENNLGKIAIFLAQGEKVSTNLGQELFTKVVEYLAEHLHEDIRDIRLQGLMGNAFNYARNNDLFVPEGIPKRFFSTIILNIKHYNFLIGTLKYASYEAKAKKVKPSIGYEEIKKEIYQSPLVFEITPSSELGHFGHNQFRSLLSQTVFYLKEHYPENFVAYASDQFESENFYMIQDFLIELIKEANEKSALGEALVLPAPLTEGIITSLFDISHEFLASKDHGDVAMEMFDSLCTYASLHNFKDQSMCDIASAIEDICLHNKSENIIDIQKVIIPFARVLKSKEKPFSPEESGKIIAAIVQKNYSSIFHRSCTETIMNGIYSNSSDLIKSYAYAIYYLAKEDFENWEVMIPYFRLQIQKQESDLRRVQDQLKVYSSGEQADLEEALTNLNLVKEEMYTCKEKFLISLKEAKGKDLILEVDAIAELQKMIQEELKTLKEGDLVKELLNLKKAAKEDEFPLDLEDGLEAQEILKNLKINKVSFDPDPFPKAPKITPPRRIKMIAHDMDAFGNSLEIGKVESFVDKVCDKKPLPGMINAVENPKAFEKQSEYLYNLTSLLSFEMDLIKKALDSKKSDQNFRKECADILASHITQLAEMAAHCGGRFTQELPYLVRSIHRARTKVLGITNAFDASWMDSIGTKYEEWDKSFKNHVYQATYESLEICLRSLFSEFPDIFTADHDVHSQRAYFKALEKYHPEFEFKYDLVGGAIDGKGDSIISDWEPYWSDPNIMEGIFSKIGSLVSLESIVAAQCHYVDRSTSVSEEDVSDRHNPRFVVGKAQTTSSSTSLESMYFYDEDGAPRIRRKAVINALLKAGVFSPIS